MAKICPERANHTFCETFFFLLKTGYLSHCCVPRYARKQIKGFKDSDDSLVSKNLSQKMAHWVGAQDPAILAKKNENMPPL